MKIVTFRELQDKDDIILLWAKSFGWLAAPHYVERWAELDKRLGVGPIGFCGIVDGKLAGFVGTMEIPTRTKDGEIEIVGGIHAIATRPSMSKKGIAKKLLIEAEDYFRSRGIRLSFLTTARSIVAYKWYRNVGYEDVAAVDRYPYMYKVFTKPQKPLKRDKMIKLDYKVVSDVFESYVADKCGFVIREGDHYKALEFLGVVDRKLSISVENGYAMLRNSCDAVRVGEILARTKKAYRLLIRHIESMAKYGVMAVHPYDPVAQTLFRERKYREDPYDYDLLMVKSLAGVRFDDLYDDTFMLSRVDWF